MANYNEEVVTRKEKANEFARKKVVPFLKNIAINHNYFISLILILILGRIASDNFLSIGSLMNILRTSTVIGIIALGMTLVIISGNIDLSVGSTMALTAALGVLVYNGTRSIFITLIFAIAMGTVLGFINGFFIGKTKVAAFIVTLSTMAAYRSIALQIGGGGLITLDNELYFNGLRNLAYGSFLSVNYIVWIFIFVLSVILFLMTRTKFGRYVYAVGSNEKAAKLSGINVDRINIYIFALTGLLTGISAFLYLSRLGSVNAANTGNAYELDAIASVAIGGTSMAGGKGFVQGTFFGVLIISSINGVLTAFGVSPFANGLIKGSLILGAVLMQKALKAKRETS